MNITRDQFEALVNVMQVLPQGNDFKALEPDKQKLIVNYVSTLNDLVDKRRKDNKRIAKYIANKRKHNKDYAR